MDRIEGYMDQPLIYYLPVVTTVLTLIFAAFIYRRYLQRGRWGNHLLWWTIGVLTFGMGTFSEAYHTLLGWNPVIFRFWYIVGAFLGGAPLATGTIWLLLKPQTARKLTVALILVVSVASVLVILSPVTAPVDKFLPPHGSALDWRWVRFISPFINTYATVFLVGGAIISAVRFRRVSRMDSPSATLARDRFLGNVGIAVGAILPAIGGTASRMGHTEILYVLELIGISIIWIGYWLNIRKRPLKEVEAGSF
jgi:hypothetical protein